MRVRPTTRLLGALALITGCGSSSGGADAALAADAPVAVVDGAEGPTGRLELEAGTNDAAPPPDVKREAAPVTPPASCGPPPYVALRLMARHILGGKQKTVSGAAVTFKVCPGVQVITDSEGRAAVNVTQGAETWVRFDAPSFLPWIVGELVVSAANAGMNIGATLIPQDLQSLLVPAYSKDRPLVYVQVEAGRGPEACKGIEGVSISVKEQPDAVVAYRGTGSVPTFMTGGTTTTEGAAIVSGVQPAPMGVTVRGTKPGCSYVAAYGDSSTPGLTPILRTPLQNGAITYQVLNPAR